MNKNMKLETVAGKKVAVAIDDLIKEALASFESEKPEETKTLIADMHSIISKDLLDLIGVLAVNAENAISVLGVRSDPKTRVEKIAEEKYGLKNPVSSKPEVVKPQTADQQPDQKKTSNLPAQKPKGQVKQASKPAQAKSPEPKVEPKEKPKEEAKAKAKPESKAKLSKAKAFLDKNFPKK